MDCTSLSTNGTRYDIDSINVEPDTCTDFITLSITEFDSLVIDGVTEVTLETLNASLTTFNTLFAIPTTENITQAFGAGLMAPLLLGLISYLVARVVNFFN